MVPPQAIGSLAERAKPTALDQVLLGNSGAEAVVGVNEVLDEFVQPALENLLHAAVLDLGASGAGLALGGTLAAIGARDVVEVLHQIAVAGCERARQLILEDQQVGDQPGLHALTIDPMIGRE